MEIASRIKDANLALGITFDQLRVYKEDGFIILRSIYSPVEMTAVQQECDRLLIEHADLIEPNNVRCRFMPHHQSGEPLFEVFDPVNDLSESLRQVCFDPRLKSVVEAIYCEPAELFKEKLIFKMPGAKGYSLHQDIPQNWTGWPQSFLTVLVAIDSCHRENGCTEVYRGYQDRFVSSDPDAYMLLDDCVCKSRREFLELEPGDVAIFHGLTPHCSAPNRSAGPRRAFYISYNAQSDGGDQRRAHYEAFQAMLTQRLVGEDSSTPYFR